VKTFYNAMVAIGLAGTVCIGLLVHTSTLSDWFKWPVFSIALLGIEFGCFAWNEKQNEKQFKKRVVQIEAEVDKMIAEKRTPIHGPN
jgi:hypothetical protein